MESTWAKAVKDTRHLMLDTLRYQVFTVVAAAAGGIIVAFAIPASVSPKMQGIWVIMGALGSALVLIIGVFFLNLFRAPYRQRNKLGIELLNLEADKPRSDMETIGQAMATIGRALVELGKHMSEANQSNTIIGSIRSIQPNISIRSIDKAVGITETVTGKPVYLVPIGDAFSLGTVSQGSKQTFSGLSIHDSPIFISVPGFGHALIRINLIGNDTFEAEFMTYIETRSLWPFTLTLCIDSQVVVSQCIPARTIGFFTQQSKASISRQGGVARGDVFIEIEAGVMRNVD